MLPYVFGFVCLLSSIVQPVQAEVVTLPSVNFASPIDYPKAELKSGQGASVLLQLTIDSDGQVLGAEVIESAGDNFDAAAIRTIERYQFNPALNENPTNLGAIQYRLVFNPEVIPPVNIRGRVLESGISRSIGQCTDSGYQCRGPAGHRHNWNGWTIGVGWTV